MKKCNRTSRTCPLSIDIFLNNSIKNKRDGGRGNENGDKPLKHSLVRNNQGREYKRCLTSMKSKRNNEIDNKENFASKGFEVCLKESQVRMFLKKLYAQKTKDLRTYNNRKQQGIFLDKLQKTIQSDRFIATQCDLGYFSSKPIAEYLQNNPLKILILDKNPLGDEGIELLSPVFEHTQLKVISLVSINITTKGAKLLLKNIVGLSTLQQINFSSPEGFNRNRFNPEGIQAIIQVLQHPNCHLKSINLANVSMGELGFIHFCEGLSNGLPLQILNLSMNDISLQKRNYEFYHRKLSKVSLKTLDLSQNRMGDMIFELLGDVLGLNYGFNPLSINLKSLNLSKNGITSSSCEGFCIHLVKNKTLTTLLLGKNWLSEGENFCHFRYLLTHNWSLVDFGLKQAVDSQTDLKCLADGIKGNHSLVSLDLSKNHFDEDTFIYLISHLSQNKSIKRLRMDGCNIIDKYIFRSEKYMKANKILECIDFSNNYLNDKGGKVLQKLVSQNKKIIKLSLTKNCINLAILSEISDILKQNELNYSIGEPQFHYYDLVQNFHEQKKNNLIENIKYLQKKINAQKVIKLIEDIIQKENQISCKIQLLEHEEQNIYNLEKQFNFERKKNLFIPSYN